MKKSNTGGLKFHVQTIHPKEFEKMFETPRTSSKQLHIDDLLNFGTQDVNMDQVFACWTAHTNLPNNLFDDNIMQNFFKLLNKEVNYPRRNVLSDIVIPEFEDMQKNFKSILE